MAQPARLWGGVVAACAHQTTGLKPQSSYAHHSGDAPCFFPTPESAFLPETSLAAGPAAPPGRRGCFWVRRQNDAGRVWRSPPGFGEASFRSVRPPDDRAKATVVLRSSFRRRVLFFSHAGVCLPAGDESSRRSCGSSGLTGMFFFPCRSLAAAARCCRVGSRCGSWMPLRGGVRAGVQAP